MLQKVLPHLRPKQHGSIAARERLELLLQNWTLSAWHMAGKPSASAAPHLVPFTPTISVTPKQRQNFKAKLPDDVWDLVESADSKERPRLVQLVCKLATPGGRVELLAMCGGQFERADSVEQASRPSSPTMCEAAQPVPASLPNRIISKGEDVVIFGAFELKWAHFNGVCGTVDSYDACTNRYAVCTSNGSRVHVHPRNVARAAVPMNEFIADVHGVFDVGVHEQVVTALKRVHTACVRVARFPTTLSLAMLSATHYAVTGYWNYNCVLEILYLPTNPNTDASVGGTRSSRFHC